MVKQKMISNHKKATKKKHASKTVMVQKKKEKLFKKQKQMNNQFKNKLQTMKNDIPFKFNEINKLKSKSNTANHVLKRNQNNLGELKRKIVSKDKFSDEHDLSSLRKGKFLGDISEEDIDSDDDLSLDENELPTPPDTTSSESEFSEGELEREEQKVEVLSPTVEKDQRTIFVGNLPKTVKKSKLKKWFAKYGTVESVRLRCAPLSDPSIPKKLAVITKAFHEERSNIHGFVIFSQVDEAKSALAANGQQFDETHHLRVDLAGGLNDQNKQRYDDKKAVFVGNLPFSAEEDQLRGHFADCGDITSIRIVRDKNTCVGKGFAFINFAARHSVRLALEKNGVVLIGRKLRVQKALYNQETVEVDNIKKNTHKNKIPPNSFVKFKKIKKKKTGEEEFQGLCSKKEDKHKKINKKKRKLKNKKETLKKILKTENKKKNILVF